MKEFQSSSLFTVWTSSFFQKIMKNMNHLYKLHGFIPSMLQQITRRQIQSLAETSGQNKATLYVHVCILCSIKCVFQLLCIVFPLYLLIETSPAMIDNWFSCKREKKNQIHDIEESKKNEISYNLNGKALLETGQTKKEDINLSIQNHKSNKTEHHGQSMKMTKEAT